MRRDAEQRMEKFKDIVRDTSATRIPPWAVLANLTKDPVKLVGKNEDYQLDEFRERTNRKIEEFDVEYLNICRWVH